MYNVDHQVKQTKIQYIFLLPTFITKLYTMNCQSGFLSSVYEIKKRWCALLAGPNQQVSGHQLLTKVALVGSRFAGSDPASGQTNKSTTFLRRFQKSAGSGKRGIVRFSALFCRASICCGSSGRVHRRPFPAGRPPVVGVDGVRGQTLWGCSRFNNPHISLQCTS